MNPENQIHDSLKSMYLKHVIKNKNDQIWERFKNAGDQFFDKRKVFQAEMKDVYAENERKKNALIEKAVAIKDVGKAGRDNAGDPKVFDRPRRVFA